MANDRWLRRSATSLVKLLALTPDHTLPRRRIVALLWPQQDASSAANALDKAVHGARRALQPALARGRDSAFVLTEDDRVALTAPDGIVVDAERFEAAAADALRRGDADLARQALQLFAAPLLVDELFAPWTTHRRQALLRLLRTLSLETAERFRQRGDRVSAIEAVQRLVQLDPEDDEAAQLLQGLHDEAEAEAAGARRSAVKRAAGADREPGAGVLPAAVAPPDTAAAAPLIVAASFRNGIIRSARFTGAGAQLLANANWDRRDFFVYRCSVGADTTVPVVAEDVELLAVCAEGHLALARDPRPAGADARIGSLTIQPGDGAEPIELADRVLAADWQPGRGSGSGSGAAGAFISRLAVVREAAGTSRLEFPLGTLRHDCGGRISHPRFSADGRWIAFIEHPVAGDAAGAIALLDLNDRAGRARTLTAVHRTIRGLAWQGDQICFAASATGLDRSLHGVGLDGAQRGLYRGLGNLTVHDGSASKTLLVAAERCRLGMAVRHAAEPAERDLSWQDSTVPCDISRDGSRLLVEDVGSAGRRSQGAYLRHVDGSGTRRVGDGVPVALAPDERTVLLRRAGPPTQLSLLDLRDGQQRPLSQDPAAPLLHGLQASFFPDGQQIAFTAGAGGGASQLYLQSLHGGAPRCLTPRSMSPRNAGLRLPSNHAVSPSGEWVIVQQSDGRLGRCSVADGSIVTLPGLPAQVDFIRWADDGRELFLRRSAAVPAIVLRYNLDSAQTRPWLELMPSGVSGVTRILNIRLSGDGRSCAYGYAQEASDLYCFNDVG
ncbi:MAG: PD40 domain-containing protein [Rubrivivax sp.]|nr:PD40 domain-containing protein [Rubrivivax sp.]